MAAASLIVRIMAQVHLSGKHSQVPSRNVVFRSMEWMKRAIMQHGKCVDDPLRTSQQRLALRR
ncbi:hypothetical protein, partial [Bradyrhizobium sp.]|uniref:hypothetical protein n=1 Tax=Bradyrhizobium sp. TaxID=376 RepID=UPI00391D085D